MNISYRLHLQGLKCWACLCGSLKATSYSPVQLSAFRLNCYVNIYFENPASRGRLFCADLVDRRSQQHLVDIRGTAALRLLPPGEQGSQCDPSCSQYSQSKQCPQWPETGRRSGLAVQLHKGVLRDERWTGNSHETLRCGSFTNSQENQVMDWTWCPHIITHHRTQEHVIKKLEFHKKPTKTQTNNHIRRK